MSSMPCLTQLAVNLPLRQRHMPEQPTTARTRCIGPFKTAIMAIMQRPLALLRSVVLILLGLCVLPHPSHAQTPSPLQEWQYSAGIDLMQMFLPQIPTWRVDVGVAADYRPLYEGAATYRVLGGPIFDIRYQNLAFFSVGEGLGVNVIRGANYRAGVSIGYDLGRRDEQDLTHLSGLGDIGRAPVVRMFGDYAISKDFPLVLRVDARKFVGGARGWVGDVDAYLPLPGSSKKFVMFAGPSLKIADRLHMQTEFGVANYQSVDSGYPIYNAHGGLNAAGFGFSGTWFLSTKWLINVDAASNHLLGSATDSPIVQRRTQNVGVLSAIYRW